MLLLGRQAPRVHSEQANRPVGGDDSDLLRCFWENRNLIRGHVDREKFLLTEGAGHEAGGFGRVTLVLNTRIHPS